MWRSPDDFKAVRGRRRDLDPRSVMQGGYPIFWAGTLIATVFSIDTCVYFWRVFVMQVMQFYASYAASYARYAVTGGVGRRWLLDGLRVRWPQTVVRFATQQAPRRWFAIPWRPGLTFSIFFTPRLGLGSDVNVLTGNGKPWLALG